MLSLLAQVRMLISATQNEAGDAHGQDLQSLRAESQATIEQLRSAHQSTIEGLKAEHEAALEAQVQNLEKQITTQSLELKATGEDRAKAKAALTASLHEVEGLKAQLDDARHTAAIVAGSSASEQVAEFERLRKELSNTKDDLLGLSDVFNATKESMKEMSSNHVKELEEAAKGRVEEVTALKAQYEAEFQSIVAEKSDLLTRLSDLEGELATAKASVNTDSAPTHKRNGSAQVLSPSVTKDELQKMHEAHNLKLHDLQAQHEKAMKVLQEQFEAAQSRAAELEQDVERKTMEIKYLEQDQEESTDQITRYVRCFGFKSFIGSMFALAMVIGFI